MYEDDYQLDTDFYQDYPFGMIGGDSDLMGEQ